ncbi:MAG: putative lipoprotein, partial [Rhodospirillales bacterium]|nr:putative lipoprotein [Rhodospirillales bacterium]
NVVLPVRDEYEREHQTKPKVTLVGHSFGARALMATLSQPPALKDKGLPAIREFADGDSFISLEGAFETDKLFEDQNVANGLNKELDSKKLRTILVASQFDEAVKVAFWDTYAGSVDGFDKLCVDQRASTKKIIDCEVVQANMESRYGFNQCRATKVRPAQIDRSEEARVLYLDASAVINCNAAFTGGGSHSDIYRLEMAHMLWDYLNIKPKLGDKLAQN